MNKFLQDLWEQLTWQVCKCKHTKRHHIKLVDWLATRSDVQCSDWVFNGGAYGEHGSLFCCQCLSYNQKELPFKMWFYRLKWSIFGMPKLPSAEWSLNNTFCICGHSAREHSMGKIFDPMYPPCEKCACKEYDYVNNPKIAINKTQKEST